MDNTQEEQVDILAEINTSKTFYSVKAITISTFLTGPITGAYMIYCNFKQMNEDYKAKMTWVVLAAVIIGLVVVEISFPDLPGLVTSAVVTLLASFMSKRYQEDEIANALSTGAALHTIGRIVAVCLISLAITLAIAFVAVLLTYPGGINGL